MEWGNKRDKICGWKEKKSSNSSNEWDTSDRFNNTCHNWGIQCIKWARHNQRWKERGEERERRREMFSTSPKENSQGRLRVRRINRQCFWPLRNTQWYTNDALMSWMHILAAKLTMHSSNRKWFIVNMNDLSVSSLSFPQSQCSHPPK